MGTRAIKKQVNLIYMYVKVIYKRRSKKILLLFYILSYISYLKIHIISTNKNNLHQS